MSSRPRPIQTSCLPRVTLPIRDPPCHAPMQFRPLLVLRLLPADVDLMTYPDLADRSLASFDDYDNYGAYNGDVTAGVTSMEEHKERDIVLSDVVLPMVVVVLMVTLPIRDPTCHAPAQFRPLNVLWHRFGIQPIAPQLILLR